MDIGKAFSFVFEDEEWVSKVLLGGLIALIPLIGQITVVGYSLKVAQNVAQGNPRPLPTWSEFGDHLMRGLYEFVIRLVYALPIIVVAAIARFVVTNRLGEALKFAEVIALVRRNVGPWEMMLVVALLASFVAGLG